MLFGAGTSPPAPLPQTGHTKQPHNLASKFKLLSKEEMAALDAKAHVGLFATVPHQHPPYTRAKYLEYFSFVPYEKVPQTQMNGGSRSAQMGRVLRLPFTDRKAAEATHNHTLTEDDVRPSVLLPFITFSCCLYCALSRLHQQDVAYVEHLSGTRS